MSDVEESGTPPITRIIVVAYYRSGSTFVSDLLQLGNNSFHLCEPFYAIYAHWYGTVGYHEVLFKGDGTRRYVESVVISVFKHSLQSEWIMDLILPAVHVGHKQVLYS